MRLYDKGINYQADILHQKVPLSPSFDCVNYCFISFEIIYQFY